MAHTPGPWHREWVVDGAFQVSGQANGDKCVIASRAPFPSRHFEFAANARLIAAAPELLAACQAMFAASRHGAEYTDDEHAALALIEAAIAKAEGK